MHRLTLQPDEIALAILGEINAVFSERSSGFLREKPGSIHERQTNLLEQPEH